MARRYEISKEEIAELIARELGVDVVMWIVEDDGEFTGAALDGPPLVRVSS